MAKLIPEFYLPADFITKHSINIKRILQKSHSHRVQVTVTQEIVLWNTLLLRKLDDWSHLHAFLININTLCMYKYGTVKNGTVKVHRYSLQSGHRPRTLCAKQQAPTAAKPSRSDSSEWLKAQLGLQFKIHKTGFESTNTHSKKEVLYGGVQCWGLFTMAKLNTKAGSLDVKLITINQHFISIFVLSVSYNTVAVNTPKNVSDH